MVGGTEGGMVISHPLTALLPSVAPGGQPPEVRPPRAAQVTLLPPFVG